MPKKLILFYFFQNKDRLCPLWQLRAEAGEAFAHHASSMIFVNVMNRRWIVPIVNRSACDISLVSCKSIIKLRRALYFVLKVMSVFLYSLYEFKTQEH